MKTRIGKIARLPGAVREELNRRLHNGALGKELVPWLNELPDVQRVLADLFDGRPISEDNLSEWRRGGFQDWLLQEERRVRIEQLAGQYQNLGPEAGAKRLDGLLRHRLALELMEELERLSAMTDRNERWKRLQTITRELCRLQRTRLRANEVALLEAKASNRRQGPVKQFGSHWELIGLKPLEGEGRSSVAQASSPASSRGVPPRVPTTGGETPPELAAGTATLPGNLG